LYISKDRQPASIRPLCAKLRTRTDRLRGIVQIKLE
jgi:hypothetical protein